ncbi:MAG: DapH/DapD/GlmU-related protein [Anaerolineales bacterium]
MNRLSKAFDTPWKLWNQLGRWMIYPQARLLMTLNGIAWGRGWSFYGLPILQKHRHSVMKFGEGFSLRSSAHSNPLAPNHPVVLSTLRAGAVLEIGRNFGMTGGSICAATRVTIGNNVAVGANCVITDTDFHPLHPHARLLEPQNGKSEPVVIGDNVFIGMNSIVLKGVTIGANSVIGAGSVVSRSIPADSIAAGSPAVVIRKFEDV